MFFAHPLRVLCVSTVRSKCAVLLALLFVVPAAALADDTPVAQESIVRLEDGVLIGDVLATYNATLEATVNLGSRPTYLIGLPEGISEIQFIALAENDDRIKDARLNFTAAAPDPSTQSFFFPIASIYRPSQALRPDIAITSPAPTGGLGSGVIVAVVDTGVDPMLQGFGGGGVLEGVSFVPGTSDAADEGDGNDSDGDGITDELVGHGTFVASTVLLVAPEAQIMPVRVLDGDGKGNMFRIAQGIEAAVVAGAHVINVSLGSTADVDVVEDVIEEANLLGITVIAASGNGGEEMQLFPAASPGVIAVASTDGDGTPSGFSSFGQHVFIGAPGNELVGAVPGGSAQSSGTSFSAALVSGAAAALLSVDQTLLPAQIGDRIAAAADPLVDPDGAYTGLFGAGILNISALLDGMGVQAPYLRGDLNLDGSVDLPDLNTLLAFWGGSGPVGDVDSNGSVELPDLNLLLSVFGETVQD